MDANVKRLMAKMGPRGYDCVCGNLRMAARAVTAVYDRHLRDVGLQASQLAVLWAVAGLRSAPVKDLAAALAMHDTALMRNLRVLETRGWVAIDVGRDRRQRIVTLTDAGHEAFAAAIPRWTKAQREVARVLDDGVEQMNARLLSLARQVS
ncbi:MAG: transcriptional regulator [Proteobacteria bacterium]|nr:transcriptional regulator [Pseudomonadota bacterium]